MHRARRRSSLRFSVAVGTIHILMADPRTIDPSVAEFGPNVWLVDEMYHRFLDDPGSVSEAWQEFFEDYEPHFPAGGASPGPAGVGGPPTSRPSAGRDLPPLRGGQTREPSAGRDLPPLRGGQTREPSAGRDLPPAPTGVGGPPTPPPAAAGAPSPSLRPGDEAEEEPAAGAGAEPLKGIPAAIARRMDESLAVPTATSVRTIPAKLLEVNRRIVNNQLARLTTGGKVSFTHLIGWAIVRAFRDLPELNVAYAEIDGAPHVVRHPHVNLGLAVDLERPDGSRVLLVPNIREADTLDFERFWLAYEDLIRKARTNRLVPDDFAGTTVTLTNPGTIGTVQSVPRLMPDQGVIVGVGAIQFPPEFQAADARYLARQGIGRVVTLTSTYDHRVIQGAQSGELLARIHALLLGEDGFYDEVFEALGVPYTPARWAVDDNPPIGSPAWSEKQANVFRIVNAYRVRGHLIADLDPLRQQRPTLYAELDPLFYGLTIWDLDREFATGGLGGLATMELGDILARLRDAYCRTTGVEFMHIQETAQKQWLQERLEAPRVEVTHDERLRILRKLNQAEAFEKFLHTKYVGHKRFGLEGSESLIPLLDALLGAAAGDGVEEVVFGMAHRGRLNVLANILGKSFSKIFREFEGDLDAEATGGSGDVKYHLGTTGTYDSEAGEVDVQLVANPSHLEAVNPVLEGVARAKQERMGQEGHRAVLPVLIHGDAAFAGQGVVVETFHLSQLRGYRTGGTVHVVINNQVGFTTSALDARSSFYATDVAKTVQAPIIHVNGDDPEAVTRAARLAFAFRQAFHKDVVIDLIAYRRRGHNEGDEPSYTQPLMYKLIDERRSVRKLYLERLVNTGEISMEDGEALLEEFRGLMEQAFSETRDSAARTAPDVPVAPEPPALPVTSVPGRVSTR
jgi:multifunctional 2-oxoglutarate metabolism enzyme